jgi:hypothetical protein
VVLVSSLHSPFRSLNGLWPYWWRLESRTVSIPDRRCWCWWCWWCRWDSGVGVPYGFPKGRGRLVQCSWGGGGGHLLPPSVRAGCADWWNSFHRRVLLRLSLCKTSKRQSAGSDPSAPPRRSGNSLKIARRGARAAKHPCVHSTRGVTNNTSRT